MITDIMRRIPAGWTGAWRLGLATLLAAAVVIGGCAAEPAGPTSTTAAPAKEQAPTQTAPTATVKPAAAPVVLRIGTTRSVKVANTMSDYWYGVIAGLTTHDGLTQIDGKLGFNPGLADKWEASDGGKVWRFHIAKNAKWHDGRPVTPADVKFSMQYRMAKDPQSAWMKEAITSIDVEGDVVVFRMAKPYSTLLIEFMSYTILPQHIWERVEEPLKYTEQQAAIGSGPYVLEKLDLNAGLLAFAANPDYFRGKPAVDRLEFRLYKNVDSMTMALSKGEVDVTWDYSASIPYTSVPVLLKAEGVKFANEVDMAVPVALGFNLAKYPMSERRFREAVSYAVNYAQIGEAIFAGYGKPPSAAFVPPTMPLHDSSHRALRFDAKKAAELLDSIGMKDVDGDGLREAPQGHKIKITILSRTDSAPIQRSAELLQGYLKAIGVDSVVRQLDMATWVALKDKKEYDLVLFRTTPWGMLMHAGYGSGYFDSRRSGAGVLHNLDAASYLELCDEILRTTDEARYRELVKKLQGVYAEELPAIALSWAENVYPYRAEWEGWQMNLISGGLVNRASFFSLRPSGK